MKYFSKIGNKYTGIGIIGELISFITHILTAQQAYLPSTSRKEDFLELKNTVITVGQVPELPTRISSLWSSPNKPLSFLANQLSVGLHILGGFYLPNRVKNV